MSGMRRRIFCLHAALTQMLDILQRSRGRRRSAAGHATSSVIAMCKKHWVRVIHRAVPVYISVCLSIRHNVAHRVSQCASLCLNVHHCPPLCRDSGEFGGQIRWMFLPKQHGTITRMGRGKGVTAHAVGRIVDAAGRATSRTILLC